MLCKCCAHNHVCPDCEVAAEEADFATMSDIREDEPGLGPTPHGSNGQWWRTIRQHYKGRQYKGRQGCVIGDLVAGGRHRPSIPSTPTSSFPTCSSMFQVCDCALSHPPKYYISLPMANRPCNSVPVGAWPQLPRSPVLQLQSPGLCLK